MLKNFWTPGRKKRLIKYSKLLTLAKIAAKFRKTEDEVEKALQDFAPHIVPKIKIYYATVDNQRVKITVYSKRTAYGAFTQSAIATGLDGLPRLQKGIVAPV